MVFSRIRGQFAGCYLLQRRCVWRVVAVFRLRSTPRSPPSLGHHPVCGGEGEPSHQGESGFARQSRGSRELMDMRLGVSQSGQ